jgi:hypothetical protein
MLELPNVKKVIAIEEAFRYVPILEVRPTCPQLENGTDLVGRV